MKKKPQRQCSVTRESFNKEDLFRVVRTPSGEVILDMTGKANGRGAYVSKSVEVIEKARSSKVLDKRLEIQVPNEIYDRMLLFLKMK